MQEVMHKMMEVGIIENKEIGKVMFDRKNLQRTFTDIVPMREMMEGRIIESKDVDELMFHTKSLELALIDLLHRAERVG